MLEFVIIIKKNKNKNKNNFMLLKFLLDNFSDFHLFCYRLILYTKFHIFCFSIFSFIIIIFSLCLVFTSNPIYSVISLIIIYLFSAFILILFEIHFLAVIFILIYLGAVIVLFLFIVMMLNIKVQNGLKIFNIIPLIFLIGIFFSLFKNLFLFNLDNIGLNFYFNLNYFKEFYIEKSFFIFDFYSYMPFFDIYIDFYYLCNIKFKKENYIIFGFLLYNYFYIEIIIASFILLIAMIGCITLTLNSKIENNKRQEPMDQLLHKNLFYKRKVLYLAK
jgi:NADH:ubiquinone oxidoreductase subunit 6 (subunit J)